MADTNTPAKPTRSRSWFIVCPNVKENGVASLTNIDAQKMQEKEICEYVVNQ